MSSTVKSIRPKAAIQIPEPPIARFLFADTRMAWVWLIVRLYVGYQWFTAGFEKLTGYSATIGNDFGTKVGDSWIFTSHLGAQLTGFAHGGIAQAAGPYPAVQGWYAWYLPGALLATMVLTAGYSHCWGRHGLVRWRKRNGRDLNRPHLLYLLPANNVVSSKLSTRM